MNTSTTSRIAGGIQLPDDVRSVGYRQVLPFDWQQVFTSTSKGFTGTENEFIKAGLAYRFVQTSPTTRRVVH